jgi:uncharacterized membrane protein
MAGVGFKLNKYFGEKDLLGNIKGCLYSVVISSGPWLISVLAIACISGFAQNNLNGDELFTLRATISYTFAFSLVFFGIIEMPITRYLADKLYVKDSSSFKSLYTLIVVASVIVGSFTGGIFYSFFDYPVLTKVTNIAFFISVFSIWVAMVFLSAAKYYTQIVLSFLVGGVISILIGVLAGELYGLRGYIFGFTVGQMSIALLLTVLLFIEFDGKDYFSLDFLTYFRKYYKLILVGLFYYSGIWIDKVIFWFSEHGKNVEGLFFTNLYYDTSMFLAYISIVPSMAIFLVKVETDFYKKYLYYFTSIDKKATLDILDESASEIIDSLRNTLSQLLKMQIFITLSVWYFAPQILESMRLPSMHLAIFKYGVIGALLQSLFLILNIVQLYFGAYSTVMMNYFIFVSTNATFSLITVTMGFEYHGMGYALSCLCTLIATYLTLDRRLKSLNFFTFMGQPLSRKNYTESA